MSADRQEQEQQLDAEQHHHAGGGTWPASLVSASRPHLSSSTPSRQISAAGDEHARPSAGVVEAALQQRQLRGHQHAGGHPEVHRHARRSRGVGIDVHVPVARPAAITRHRIAATRTTGRGQDT